MHQLQSEDVIAGLQSGRVQIVEDLYVAYRAAFFRWAGRRFDANRQDLEDAWQEAVLALYTQVVSGKLTALHCGVQVWLFVVGYRRLLNHNRKMKRILWKDSIDEALLQESFLPEMQETDSGKKESLQRAMKTMSDQCREMLVQRYFLEKSLEEIQQEWQLNSANTASATLSRCLKRLKDLIKAARLAAF